MKEGDTNRSGKGFTKNLNKGYTIKFSKENSETVFIARYF